MSAANDERSGTNEGEALKAGGLRSGTGEVCRSAKREATGACRRRSIGAKRSEAPKRSKHSPGKLCQHCGTERARPSDRKEAQPVAALTEE